MVYIRRYLSGQQATTVTIAQGAITSDKIVDGAVTHPKLAPGSVDSEKVIDSSLKSEDIQDGQIKAVDLAPNAVTTDKILDGAVTTQKLEAAIQGIARPLTPGVDTAEIQDAKVTLAKLAPDSVDASKIKSGAVGPTELAAAACEESRIKDGAISTAKIAGGAIDSTKIGVGAVDGSAILNGSVGVTELATDSVETIKVKDRNITGAKIALNSVLAENIKADEDLASRMPDNSILPAKIHVPALSLAKDKEMNRFFDDFMGAALHPAWVQTGAAGYSIIPSVDSCVELKTGALQFDDVELNWGDTLGAGPTGTTFPHLVVGLRDRVGVTHQGNFVGLWQSATNLIGFYADSVNGETPTWKAWCIKAGASELVDTLIPVSIGIQKLEINVEALDDVFFYINDGQVANITDVAKIPDIDVEPRIRLLTDEAAYKSVKVDFVSLLQFREAP